MKILIGIIIFLFALVQLSWGAGCIQINWDPYINDGRGPVIGFKIYTGTVSRVYGAPTAIAPSSLTEYIITNLTRGTVYFIAVTAYDATGESMYSNEAKKTAILCGPAKLR